ncbi:MAG: hypothetical protein AAFN41_02880 [Planctomycetota bacterium]
MKHATLRVLAVVGVAVSIAAAAGAQQTVSPRELLAENERLTEEIRAARALIERLESELSIMRNERRGLLARVRDAEQVLSALRLELEASETGSAGTGLAQRAPAPADALASPASLLRELRNRYFETMRGVPDATAAERAEYKQQVALWCRLTNRELRGRRTWLVELDDLIPLRGGRAVGRLSVIDEESGLPIAEAVDVEVPRLFIDRVENDPRYDRWLLTAVVIAAPRYNAERATRGVFEYPPFIGPYVDFDFELDWISLRGWREGQAEPAEASAPDAEAAEQAEASAPENADSSD